VIKTTKLDFSLQGKVALVTGGSRGIGKATALAFARAGADVVVASRKISDLELVAGEISKLGRKSLAVPAHIGKLEEIDNLVNKVMEKFDRIDILVNNAGISPALASTLNAEERLWDAIMNVNLKGLYFLTQAVARIMKDHGGGKIINVASLDGFKPEVDMGLYCISKAGVVMATKVMALEFAQYNIRVNAIAPGLVHTRLGDAAFVIPGYEKAMVERTPLRYIADPDEITGAMVYLASDASSFHTGDTLKIDGGIMLT